MSIGMYELKPRNGQASFHGKAHVVLDGTGNIYLYSYCTPVAVVHNFKLHRLWSDYMVRNGVSNTTWKHVRAFCEECRIPVISKADWDKLDLESNWTCPIND